MVDFDEGELKQLESPDRNKAFGWFVSGGEGKENDRRR